MTPPLACRGWPVKLGQPDPGNAGEGGSSPDNVRDGSALSDGPGPASSHEKVYARNHCLKPCKSNADSNLADLDRCAARDPWAALRGAGSTPKPARRCGGEATVKVRGVTVAMLSGSRWAPPSSIDSVVNVGTIHGRPPSGHPVRWWAGPLPTEGRRGAEAQ
jgi:hypothetical protein